MVLALRLLLGVDPLPLRPVVQHGTVGMGVGPRHCLGAVLGQLENLWILLWLGASAPHGLLSRGFWLQLPRFSRRDRF